MSKYDFKLDLNTRNSLSILVNRVQPNSTVLEFGPAHGRLTKYLTEELNCKVYCVEIDKNAAKDTTLYCEKIIVDNIENYAWMEEFQDIKFDYILFADVLEHLYFPKKVLSKSRMLLNSQGSILLSIPNITHNSVIIDLLENKFIYRKTGILDNTHIRFFTKTTFCTLVNDVGLSIAYQSAVYTQPIDTEFNNSYASLPNEIASYLKKLKYGEVYQFIFELKNEKQNSIESDLENDHCSSRTKDDIFKLINKYKISIDTNAQLWERVNQSESQLEESNNTNAQLWGRVNQIESQLEESNQINQELWQRVNQTESQLQESNDINGQLWGRVNQTESQLEESNQINQELWQRVNQSESQLEEIKQMSFISYIKRYYKND